MMESPQSGARQIFVDVNAASVSFMDCLLVMGKYQVHLQAPYVPSK